MVQPVLGEEGLLGVLGGGLLTLGGLGLGLLEETGLLLLLGLGLVLVQELEELGSGVLVQGVAELSDRRGDLKERAIYKYDIRPILLSDRRTHLEPLVEDDLLPLEPDVLGPLDESGQVGLGGQVSTDTERPRLLLEERVLGSLLGLGTSGGVYRWQ